METTNKDGLSVLSGLGDALFDAEVEVMRLERELDSAKKSARDLAENVIPEKMDALGIAEFKTSAGVKISVVGKVRCGDLKRPAGLEWLRENGQGGLIRSEVVVPFAKEDEAEARSFVQDMRARKLDCTLSQRVAWNSLASVIKGLLEDGEDVPLELLGAYLQRSARIAK